MVRLSPDTRVWALSAALTAAGAALWVIAPRGASGSHIFLWVALAVLFALGERHVVHLPVGRENYSLSFNDVPLLIGLLYLGTDELVVAAVAGVTFAMAVLYRSAPIKIAFNASLWIVQAPLAVVLYTVLLRAFEVGSSPLAPLGWLAAFLAVVATTWVGSLGVFAVVSLRQEGRPTLRFLGGLLISNLVSGAVCADLVLVAALLIEYETPALLLLVVLAVLTFALYRGYHVQRAKYGRLEQLYDFTRSVDQAQQNASVVGAVQREARALMRARVAQVIRVGPDGPTGPRQWWAPACAGATLLLARGRHNEPHPALFGTGYHDALVAPLREGGRTTGVIVVADRLDDLSTFDAEDARLFEALAGHAAIALANSGLVEEARAAAARTEHLARHDPLTGLPNRLHFQQQLERRLQATGSAAVILMDVDRFKEVNDTLGHDVGDELVQQVGQRLRELENDETVVARLGGDEFAVLLGDDAIHVEGMLQHINRDFRRPFVLRNVELDVTASIGIAMAPRDGSSAALLLRRAEVAMYDAKRSGAGIRHYATERDPYSKRRLSLIGDLARALDDGSLQLHYQPQAEAASGRVTGVEALLRWHHPAWGNVPPDEFIPLAEHTGLIRPLTQFVLETAVRQCAEWRRAGTPVLMAVNVSMRNLLETDLADVVARLLVQANLPAGLLKIEVTESAIVADPERAVSALERLVSLGLRVSIDDFGTGYSSLTRLRNLPVHEVKIDRAFVRNLAHSPEDLAIVRAVINLGHDLGVGVVAEGVEDGQAWRILDDLGCDLVQGYLLARPMPAMDMTGWLTEHFATFATRLRQGDGAQLSRPQGLAAADPKAEPSDPGDQRRTAGEDAAWPH